ncbi:hypothetical protein HYH03_007185 [Edaphochlamys debaryana]|uniref:Uncharacterized protein n=1 Tax=Edaphochlamys debaryana TaxID=47281 RepID=A0A835Y3R9_9CHLO|nr:hypothetical protein HYH03_007185 [Edaphochlamys debaryana]|eukprot:KAG2494669.1 hypothetical protein HYH03_007185 [Edaphochlamys debaryana]
MPALFAEVPEDDRRRITAVSISCEPDGAREEGEGEEDEGVSEDYEEEGEPMSGPTVSGDILSDLLDCLPALQALELRFPTSWDPDDDPMPVIPAFATLQHLTSITVATADWLDSLDDGTLARLTHLETVASERPHWQQYMIQEADAADPSEPRYDSLVNTLGKMTALKRLRLAPDYLGDADAFTAADLPGVLAALPPSVEEFSIDSVLVDSSGLHVHVRGRLNGAGFLQSLTFMEDGDGDGDGDEWLPYITLSKVLTDALLPSPRLGPRLPVLEVRARVDIDEPLPTPDPLMELLARVDAPSISFVRSLSFGPGTDSGGGPLDAALEVAEGFGVPDELQLSFSSRALKLRGHDKSRAGGSGQAAVSPPPPVLPPAELLKLVVARMKVGNRRATTATQPTLLHGTSLARLLASPGFDLQAWVTRLDEGLRHTPTGPMRVLNFNALPGAGAVVLTCSSSQAAAAAVVAARKAGVEAVAHCLAFEVAAHQVLQSLWDGAQKGMGAGAGSNPGGSGRGGGRSGTARSGNGMHPWDASVWTWEAR